MQGDVAQAPRRCGVVRAALSVYAYNLLYKGSGFRAQGITCIKVQGSRVRRLGCNLCGLKPSVVGIGSGLQTLNPKLETLSRGI